MRKYFGDRQFYLAFLAIALPTMAQQFITSFVSLIDNIMIGGLGEVALTAVTTANKFYVLNFALTFGLAGGASIFISQFFGAHKHKEVQETFDIAFVAGVVVGLFFTLALAVFPRELLSVFTSNPVIIDSALDYLRFAKFTFLPFGLSMAISMSLRSVKIVKLSLKIGTVAVLTNTLFNYLLIFGNFGFPQLGTAGAGLATLIARIVEFGLYLYCLNYRDNYLKVTIGGLFHLNGAIIKRMIYKVIPLTLNEIIYSLGTTIIFMAYLRTDEILVAGISVIDTVGSLLFVLFAGISSAVMVLIGNELGANELEKAKENSLKLVTFSVLIAGAIGLIIFLVAPYIHLLYNLTPETNHLIEVCLKFKSVWVIANGISVCVFFILRSGGDTRNTFLLDSGFMVIAIIVATSLSFTAIELVRLFMIVEGIEFIKAIGGLYFYNKGNWIKNLT